MQPKTRNVFVSGVLLLLFGAGAAAQTLNVCGDPFTNGVGPFDYLIPEHRYKRLKIVEKYHFNKDVETLTKGQSSIDILQDIDYVLRASPNHHRALNAMAKYFIRKPARAAEPGRQTPNCYFQRAMQFRGDDGTVYMIHGMYLAKLGHNEEALLSYERALDLMPDSPEANYNMGLLRTDLKQYDEALTYARKAYDLGIPLPGLRNRLLRAGVWE